MKKTITFIAALAVSVVCLTASAQEKQMFNHLSVGITAGVDGMGIEVGTPVLQCLQVRAGYSFLPFTISPTISLGTLTLNNGKSLNLNNVDNSIDIWESGLGKLFVDYYPSSSSSFHFTAGVFIGSGTLIHNKLDLRQAMQDLGYPYGTSLGRNDISFSTDEDGYAYIDGTIWKVLPYVGIGFGRAIDAAKVVTVNFDLGIMFNGGIKMQTYDYSNPVKTETYTINSAVFEDSDGTKLDHGLVDLVSSLPIFPYAKLGVLFRIF